MASSVYNFIDLIECVVKAVNEGSPIVVVIRTGDDAVSILSGAAVPQSFDKVKQTLAGVADFSIQMVPVHVGSNTFYIWCDEDGHLRNLRNNSLANLLFANRVYGRFCGNVLFAHESFLADEADTGDETD